MKKSSLSLIIIFFSISAIFFLGTCSGDDLVDDIDVKFCGDGCSSGTPWRVESLNLGLPCFSSKEACVQWATSNGYSDKPCIQCN